LNEQQRSERQSLKPANVSDSLWAQVQADNPDPSRMIPVLANGFGDLDARAKWEDEALKAHFAKLEELHSRSAKLLRELDVDLTAKLTAAQQRHQALSLRLIRTMRVFEVLRKAGNRPSPSEIEAMTRLRQAASKLSLGSLEATALRTTAFQLNSLADAGRLDAFKSAKALEVANEDAQAALLSALTDSQASLQKTVESVLKDAHDLHVIRSGYRPL
jgi:nuclear pore complex protein Nup54